MKENKGLGIRPPTSSDKTNGDAVCEMIFAGIVILIVVLLVITK